MSKDPEKHKRQRRSGYLLIGSGVFLELLLIGIALSGNSTYLLPIVGGVPAFILIYHGYRSVTTSRGESLLIEDQDQAPYQKAGQTSFWVLVAVILTDEMFRFLPEEHLHTSLLYIAAFVAMVTTIYHKYFSESSVSKRSEPNNS